MQMKSNNSKKTILILVGVIVIGLLTGTYFAAKSKLWAFTPVYDQRKTTTTYFNDLYNAKYSDAYKLTDPGFQKANTYPNFYLSSQSYDSHMVTKVASYLKEGKYAVITGNITDDSNGKIYTFNVVYNGNKIDSVILTRVR
jgi:hypothetical protein